MRRDGSRTIELLIPLNGISAITFRGFTGGDEEDWHDGVFEGPRHLMCHLSGLDRQVFRSLRYPDVDRVMSEFLSCCPTSIRDMLARGEVPQYQGPRQERPATGSNWQPAPMAAARPGQPTHSASGFPLADYMARPPTPEEASFMARAGRRPDPGTGPYTGPMWDGSGVEVEMPGQDLDGLPLGYREAGSTGGPATFTPPEYNPEHAPPGREHRPAPGQDVFPDRPLHIDPNAPQDHGRGGPTGIDLSDGQ